MVPGNWGKWTSWSECIENCTEIRSRTCSNPAPKEGGIPCPGENIEKRECQNPNHYCETTEPTGDIITLIWLYSSG